MRTNYVLIDYENVHVKNLSLLKDEHFRVYLFLGPKNTKLNRDLVLAMHAFGERAAYVELETPGANALDFHIAYTLGGLTQTDPEGFYHVISKDTGFDPLIDHLKSKKIYAARSVAIDDMPCFRPPVDQSKASISSPQASEPLSTEIFSELYRGAIDDLRKRKTARPRTEKTLRSTLRAKFPKKVSDAQVDFIIRTLTKHGLVKIEGAKVTYALPDP